METNKDTSLEEKKLELEKYKYNVEVVKWFIASVVLVVLTLIIESGFRDRETGLVEMEAFDKYVSVILEENSIEKRWKLTEYFATVTPTDRLQKKWQNYRDSIRNEYTQYVSLQQHKLILENKLESVQNDTIEKGVTSSLATEETVESINLDLNEIQFKLNKLDYKLIDGTFDSAPYWEEKGFQSLFNYDVNGAIESFKESEESENGFHQVYEISNYLEKNREKLEKPNSEFWKIAFSDIANSFSWKMTEENKLKLIELSEL